MLRLKDAAHEAHERLIEMEAVAHEATAKALRDEVRVCLPWMENVIQQIKEARSIIIEIIERAEKEQAES